MIVVEDDSPLLTSLQWALEVEGYSVRAFADAGTLLAATDLPTQGCLILDYRLPDLDGLAGQQQALAGSRQYAARHRPRHEQRRARPRAAVEAE